MNNEIKLTLFDYELVQRFEQRDVQADGSLLLLHYTEDGKDEATIRAGISPGSYVVNVTKKSKRLHSLLLVKRKSTNNYFALYCEPGVRTLGGNFASMKELNAFCRESFLPQLVHGLTKPLGRV